jgi:hypothetical protein
MRMAVLFVLSNPWQSRCRLRMSPETMEGSIGRSQLFAKAQEKELKKMQERQMRPTGAQTRVSTQRLPSPTGKIIIRYSIRF